MTTAPSNSTPGPESSTAINPAPSDPEHQTHPQTTTDAQNPDPSYLEVPDGTALPHSAWTFAQEVEVVPMAKYQALASELARYKAHFGELPPEAQALAQNLADSGPSPLPEESAEDTSLPPASHIVASINPEQNREEMEELLGLLSLNDRELAHEANDLKELLELSSSSPSTPLKHFGFQRSKSRKHSF